MNKETQKKLGKAIKYMDSNKIGIFVGFLFLLSLIPIIYVGLHNYPTGDDYWYGALNYHGFQKAGIIGALKGSVQTVIQFYEEWQGTWFTIFLFTLVPSNFVEGGYVITVFIALGTFLGGLLYMADYYLIKKLNFTKGATITIVCMVSYLWIQYMPKTTSGLYWFNGVMHYSVPFCLACIAVVNTHKYVESNKIRNYVALFITFTLLGGGSYLAPLAATLAAVLILCCQLKIEEFNLKEKKIKLQYDYKNLWVIVAIIAEMIGLVISFLSPGNNVRGGEEFGLSIKWIVECIYYSIDRGIYLGVDYFTENIVTTAVYLLLAVIVWQQLFRSDREKIKFSNPLLFVIYTNGIYWATYAPEIYSRSDVSGGVNNTYFLIFLLGTLANMIYVHGWLQCKIKAKYDIGIVSKFIIVGIILLGTCINISEIKTTNDYCLEYIKSGEMEKFVAVHEEQHRILSDKTIKNAVVPETKGMYPILNMYLTEDKNYPFNIDKAFYYEKESIVAYMVE